MVFPGGSDGKESACNVEDLGLISGSGRSPGEQNDIILIQGPLNSNGQAKREAWRVHWKEVKSWYFLTPRESKGVEQEGK